MASDIDIAAEYFGERPGLSLTDAVAALERFCDDVARSPADFFSRTP